MNVFIIGTPLETAKKLDKRRLNKQIIECGQILKAIAGDTKAWANHPVTKMYAGYQEWLKLYMHCLNAYRLNNIKAAEHLSNYTDTMSPQFHTKEYFDQMKRRLYTKDPIHYAEFADLGTSDVNWYWVDGKWRHYINGKMIND